MYCKISVWTLRPQIFTARSLLIWEDTMNHPSASVTLSSTGPFHRRPPTLEILDLNNKYVYMIQDMRNNICESVGLDGGNHGLISHVLQNIRDFACSASKNTPLSSMLLSYPVSFLVPCSPGNTYVPSAGDKTYTSIQAEGFFIPTKIDVAHGR